MNKTIMCLINGLGVEQKDSCDAYTEEVMPNVERMISKNLFTSLETPATDYSSGYQIFNTGTVNSLAEEKIKKIYLDAQWDTASNYESFIKQLNDNENKLHIICPLNNNRSYDYIKSFIKKLNGSKKIILHVILKQTDIRDYKLAEKFLDSIKFDSLANTEVGIICGANLFTDDSLNDKFHEFCTILTKKVGAQWAEASQKFKIYQSKSITPINSDPFYISSNSNIENGDNVLFFSNGDDDYSKLISELASPDSRYAKFINVGSFHFFTLFPLKNINGIPSIFENVTSEISLSKMLNDINSKVLVLIDQENYNTVRYMNCGLKNESSPNISYMIVDDNILFNHEQISAIINNPEYENIIINYRIDKYNDFTSLQNVLKKIDTSVTYISNDCKDKYRLIISSLFGISKSIEKNGKPVMVNFYGKVPLIVIDSTINRSKEKLLSFSNTSYLLPTFIKSIKPDCKLKTLIVSKGILAKILYK